ncbi:VacJ family lipoprotein [Siccirubricoccus sp. KC 17139]|uniref:VacJ family lipoprotein n=1 Tax=Siccirubricoccus soli TaxID=2899147 RepID=A0ABT1DBW1_9PROT|nr:VacJ family lipoprotein [Siccirubricoccus soli]MCO6419424.1 VacJ family lipoprotein [Siccirubricoccus soli]MCP2685559.1 VacJ family lipoprotein [Siccirubricoccus soli]
MPPNTSLLALALGIALLAGCATRPDPADPDAVAEFEQNNDPAEPFNRAMYDVHQGIDRVVLRPVASAYRDVVPQPVRTGIRNVLGNLRTPVILANDMLQGEPRRAGDTLGRFVINTTLGVAGIFDVASSLFGVRGHAEDYGQTLARWGVGEGPYLFIPVLGPSNPRDLTGFGLGIAGDPLTWVGQGVAVDVLTGVRGGMTVVDTRESLLDVLDDVQRSSLDPYATLRSAYRQRRAAEIRNSGEAAPAAAGSTGFGIGTGAFPER